jgi:acyl-coenzyme A thioesterase PaaI-like protein
MGGVIAALADNAMGPSFVRVFKATVEDPANPAKGAVTVGLSRGLCRDPAKLGQWPQIEPRVVKAGRSLGFVPALITADGDIVARENATFRLPS